MTTPPKKPTILVIPKAVLAEDKARNKAKEEARKRGGSRYVRKLLPVAELAEEIYSDISDLMREFPTGIRISDLVEYYGESSSRCLSACQTLHDHQRVNLFKNHANVYQIKSIESAHSSLDELTPLQKKCVEFVYDACMRHSVLAVRTNYAQVARQIQSSFVGIQAIVHRCALNGFIKIDQKSVRGQSDALVLRIIPEKLPAELRRKLMLKLETATTTSTHPKQES